MKRKTAKEILADSFRELMEQKQADKITIRDITANCGYSTATFYRQFKNKYSLIAWDYARRYKEVMSRSSKPGRSLHDCFLDGAEYFSGQREYLANLIRHTAGFDSFVENMKAIHYEVLRNYFLALTENGYLSVMMDMYVRMYSHGATDMTCDWLLGKVEASPENLAEIYENALPQPLRELINKKNETIHG
jgi:AcrR family transcriptional regulator